MVPIGHSQARGRGNEITFPRSYETAAIINLLLGRGSPAKLRQQFMPRSQLLLFSESGSDLNSSLLFLLLYGPPSIHFSLVHILHSLQDR